MKKTTVRLITASAASALLVSALCIGSYAALQSSGITPSDEYISTEKAKEIVWAHAGVNAEAVRFDEAELDREKGIDIYEIDFYADGVEYEYDVDAITGEVLKSKTEGTPAVTPAPEVPIVPETPVVPEIPTVPEAPAEPDYIGLDAAKKIALAHAGVAATDVRFEDAEFDSDDGKAVYEIDFYADGVEYEYDVNAITGEVLKSKTEGNPAVAPAPEVPIVPETPVVPEIPTVPEAPAEPDYIGLDAAKKIALAHAGVAATDVRFEDAEFDSDDGKAVYELDFKVGAYEYEYEIDALTGLILDFEKEIDD